MNMFEHNLSHFLGLSLVYLDCYTSEFGEFSGCVSLPICTEDTLNSEMVCPALHQIQTSKVWAWLWCPQGLEVIMSCDLRFFSGDTITSLAEINGLSFPSTRCVIDMFLTSENWIMVFFCFYQVILSRKSMPNLYLFAFGYQLIGISFRNPAHVNVLK